MIEEPRLSLGVVGGCWKKWVALVPREDAAPKCSARVITVALLLLSLKLFFDEDIS